MHPGLWIIIGVNMAISLVAFFYCLLTGNWLLLRPFARWRYTKEDSNHPFSSFIQHDMFIRLKFFVFFKFFDYGIYLVSSRSGLGWWSSL